MEQETEDRYLPGLPTIMPKKQEKKVEVGSVRDFHRGKQLFRAGEWDDIVRFTLRGGVSVDVVLMDDGRLKIRAREGFITLLPDQSNVVIVDVTDF